MNILLKNATILNPQSPFHSSNQDILISSGVITKIAKKIKSDNGTQEFTFENLHVSCGWFDSCISFGEPGYEERETLSNGLEVAARSGFTKILLNSNTYPIPDSRSIIGHLIKMTQGSTTRLYPIGALTVKSEGDQMASLYDMYCEGAVAFGDHKSSINKANLLKIALQYCQSFGGIVISHPLDNELADKGVMHEGITSTRIGLPGIPSMAETIRIARDLEILKYAGGKLHLPNISTEAGLNLIRESKKQGLKVSCSVGLPQLIFEDRELENFDTNFKVFPPIRSKEDQQALRAGLLDGSIDMVSSMHEPINIEYKKLEFENALAGSLGLESCFGILCKIFPLDQVISFLTRGVEYFEIPKPTINIGSTADLTLFNPEISYYLKEEDLRSTSKNSPYLGIELKGKVLGTYNNGILTLNN
jgi:dihydroorotase